MNDNAWYAQVAITICVHREGFILSWFCWSVYCGDPQQCMYLERQGCGKKMARSLQVLVIVCVVVLLSHVHRGNSQCDGKSVLISSQFRIR